MKKKALAVIMTFVLVATAMIAAAIQPALAQDVEAADFSAIAGLWASVDTDEMLTITEEGFFIYESGEDAYQGYLEYVDEYGDGNGRYDMYNGAGAFLEGIYQDSENSIHWGNDDGTVFTRVEDWEISVEDQWEEASDLSLVLVSGVRYTNMVPLYNNSSWNDGYFYADMTEDGLLVIVDCCAKNDVFEDAISPEFRQEFAEMVSETEVKDYQDSQNQSLTEKFTYPVYDITFTTGENEDTCLWKMTFVQTDTYTYAFAFRMDGDSAEYMEEEYWNAVDTLEFMDLSYVETEEIVDDDPSANGESLEDFIAYFDSWYLYGNLNGESIRLNGDGTWEYYNAIEEDGTGGYLFDSGTFETSGTTALQLHSDSFDGDYVADVSLDEYGNLTLAPVVPGYANFYEDVVFVRESESVSYSDDDPSANGESLEDFIAYFDTWYQYGDLNAESIRLNGDGTWGFYNMVNEDGTGGYLFDSGTFVTSGTTALQLYSEAGGYVADVSLNEYGELMITPVSPDYDSIYADAAFIRESESIAYEAQPTGE